MHLRHCAGELARHLHFCAERTQVDRLQFMVDPMIEEITRRFDAPFKFLFPLMSDQRIGVLPNRHFRYAHNQIILE